MDSSFFIYLRLFVLLPVMWSVAIPEDVPARFEEKFKVEIVRRGDIAALRCDATGDQPISIIWFKDKKELEITKLSRYEKFETFQKNGDERNIKVLVVEVPGQPLNVKLLHVWARSVSIGWSAPYSGNSAITQYRVQYWRDKHGSKKLYEEKIKGTLTTAVIEGFQAGTHYAVAVVAENELGHGLPSETVPFQTIEEEPEGPPSDLWAEARAPTSILVKWKPSIREMWHGELKGYYVGYKQQRSYHPYTYESIEATASESYEYLITGLSKSSPYSIRVKAYNKAGSGPTSQELVVRTLDGDLPRSPPVSLVSTSDSALTVTWNQVVNREDPLIGYTLNYQRGTTDHWLHADTLYRIYLTAINKHGRGLASDITTVKTKQKEQYLDLSVLIVTVMVLLDVIVIISAIIIIYVVKSRSRASHINALARQRQNISAADAQQIGTVDKGRPYTQGDPGTRASLPLGWTGTICAGDRTNKTIRKDLQPFQDAPQNGLPAKQENNSKSFNSNSLNINFNQMCNCTSNPLKF
ncbi:down syndrome cell adhesion molecule homolog [Caerostris extrusa]|uniref:Down syndrome cell adhesion molecule homolog n=1 Tax=Caerostris extrusa TaxID=172846 RepID=A0AAV4XYZ1_CAEEX|nr:down syndrome cell adhesion molecule homolog [Caerostris extrusa]